MEAISAANPLVIKLQAIQNYFKSGVTKPYVFRREQLKKLKAAILHYEQELHNALYTDLKKSPEESWVTEIGFVISEINAALKNLNRWMQPERVQTNLINKPSSSFIMHEPLGVVLIIAPWNYPLQLLFTPLVGALAAGNCVVMKPGEYVPATSAVMRKIIEHTFSEQYVLYIEGDGAIIVPDMMNSFTFDHVFFTGSTQTGKIIYEMAAKRLMPVTLELGGKSPCIIESDANIKVAARRLAMTKFSNAGQMCVAPDYLLAHNSVKDQFVSELKKCITKFFSENPEDGYTYGKIINKKHFKRLLAFLSEGKIVYGGRFNPATLYIEPTIIENVFLDSPLMREEIFGPILPVITFNTKEEALKIIEENKNPLAFYLFTESKSKEHFWLNNVSFGGGCINNAGWHLTNHYLPFGGRGFSGTGHYHGKYSFDTFSHKKSVMKTPTWFDPDIKYPPFKGKLKLFKWLLR